MRVEVLQTVETLAVQDDRIVFLTGDLGYGVVESFFRRFPSRAFNAGVAEQNMMAMATGLAESGLIPFVYSIATFATLRPFEFIRNGPVIHQLPVRIIGVGGGLEYSNNGPTHFALEDVGVLRTLPGLKIICPTDSPQASAAVAATYDEAGPIYYRLSKNHVDPANGTSGEWDAARVISRGDGTVAVVALGATAGEFAEVATLLADLGATPTFVSVSQVAPAPTDLIASLARAHSCLVTVEAHNVIGGLGSLVSEVVAEHGIGVRVRRLGVRAWPVGIVGSPAYLNRWAGIDAQSIADAVRDALAPGGDREGIYR